MGWIEDIRGALGGAYSYVSGIGAAVGQAAYNAGAAVTAPPPLASPKPSPTPPSPPPPVVVRTTNPVTEATQYYNENYSVTTPGQTVEIPIVAQSQGSDVLVIPKISIPEHKGSPAYELSKARMATGNESIGRYMGADYGKSNIPGFVPYNTPETIAMVTQKAESIGREYQAGNISREESVARINELARQYNLTPQSVSGVVGVGAQKEQVDQIVFGRINPRAAYDIEYRTPGRVTEGADWAKRQIVPGIALMQPELLPATERFQTGKGSAFTGGQPFEKEGAYQYLGPYDVTQHGQTERGWLYKSEKGAYFVAEPPKEIGQEVPMSGGPAAWSGMLGSKRLELTSLTPSMPGAIPVSAREVGTRRIFKMEVPPAESSLITTGRVSAEPTFFAALAGEGKQIFEQSAMFPTLPQFPSTQVISAGVVSAKPPGAMINLFDIPGLGLAANLRVATGRSPLISAESEPGRFMSYATGGIYKTADMILGILPGHPSIAPAGLAITVPSEKPIKTVEVGSPVVTMSGGNQTITQLGTWLETNKPFVQTPEQAAVYNKYVDVYNEMSRQNPLVTTTTRTMMITGEPDKVYKYGQWDIYSEKAGAAVRNLLGGYSEEQLKAYGQTLQSQKGLEGDINRIVYGAGEFLSTRPLDVLPAATAGATMYIGGVAVGGALGTLVEGTGILATGARILATPGAGGLAGAAIRTAVNYGPLVYLAGLGAYDVTEGFTAPREKIEMNIGRSLIPGYAMLFGAAAPGLSPAVASTRLISRQGIGEAYVRGISIGGESYVYGRTQTGQFNVGWGRPGEFTTYTFGGGGPRTPPPSGAFAAEPMGFLTGGAEVVPRSGAMMMRTEPVVRLYRGEELPSFSLPLTENVVVPVGKYPPPAQVISPGTKGGVTKPVPELRTMEPYYQRGGPIGKFLDTTPTGWFKTAKVGSVINIPPTDAVRYGALESMIPSVPLLETSKQLIVPEQWYTQRRTVTTFATSPVGIIASQKIPSGRVSTVSFRPGTLVEGSPEAWTEAARSMVKITRSEGILINPYSGETVVMGRREIARVPQKIGKPEVETGKATFNIYNLPSSLKIVSGGEKIPTPDIGDITAVSFRTKFLESGAYRDLLRSGRGTVYQYITTPERYGVVRQTREVSSAISDFLTAKEPEVMDIYRYEKLPTPKHPIKLVILGSPVNLVGKFVSGLDIAGMKSEGLPTITMPSKVSREPVVSSGGQVLVYPGITTEEKLSAALQSIFEELKKAQKKPFIKESREGATVSARISRATTEQRNIAEFPAQRERLGRLQQRLPSREEVIPVSINYERYNQAMFKVMRSEEYLKGVGLQGAGEEISGITVMGHAIARGMSEGDTTGVSTRLGRMMGIEVGIAGVKGVSTRTSTSTALDEVAEQRSKIIIGLAEITDELSRVGKEEVLKKGEKETPEEKKDLYIIPRTDITTIPRTDITPKIDTKITTDIIPKIIITPVPTIIIPPVGGISGGGGAGASPRRLYTRHTQLFDYPFDPWAAARETMKVLRKGSASLTGKIPKSSVSTSVVIPKSATVPVTKMPKSGSLPSSLPKGSNKVAEKNKSKKNKRKS